MLILVYSALILTDTSFDLKSVLVNFEIKSNLMYQNNNIYTLKCL